MNFLDALSFGPAITYPPAKPVGEPSIEHGTPEEWAAYRRQQALIRDSNKLTPQEMESAAMLDTLAKSIGGGRGMVNPESVVPEGAPGSGRGSVNPTNVVPSDPATEQATVDNGILGAAFPEIFRKTALKPTYLNADNTVSNDQTSPLKPGDGRKETYFADTTFGAERVNARTSEHGVTAVKKDGTVYMTNINPDGTVNKGTGSPNSISGNGMGTMQPVSKSMPNVSGDISSTIDQLKATTDYAQARGLVGNLVTNIAAQRANMEQQAIQLAGTKFGIPQLESELQKSIQADMADPKWYPGIGDSPITAKLRAEIGQAHIMSRQFSDTYLKSNTSYASLGAYEKVAQLEFDRIKTAAERGDRLADSSADKRESVRIQQEMAASDDMAMLTPAQLQRMVILNPALGTKDKDGKINPIPVAKMMKNRDAMEAITADPTNLAVIAMERNPYARALVTRMESGLMTEQQVEMKLEELVKKANSPKFVEEYANFKFPGMKTQRDEFIQAKNNAKVSTDKAGKEEMRRQGLLEALEMERARQTDYAIMDISSILPRDGIYAAAFKSAAEKTGSTSLENVALALMKDSTTSQDAYVKKMMLAQDIQAALRRRPPSVFGSPDYNKIQQALIELTRSPVTINQSTIPTWGDVIPALR